MDTAGIEFKLLRADPSAPRQKFQVIVDGDELVTSCALLEDIAHLLSHYTELAEEGRRFELFSTNTNPYSVSVVRREELFYLRVADNFDGNILEEPCMFAALRDALASFIEEVLSKAAAGDGVLVRGLEQFRRWPGPAP